MRKLIVFLFLCCLIVCLFEVANATKNNNHRRRGIKPSNGKNVSSVSFSKRPNSRKRKALESTGTSSRLDIGPANQRQSSRSSYSRRPNSRKRKALESTGTSSRLDLGPANQRQSSRSLYSRRPNSRKRKALESTGTSSRLDLGPANQRQSSRSSYSQRTKTNGKRPRASIRSDTIRTHQSSSSSVSSTSPFRTNTDGKRPRASIGSDITRTHHSSSSSLSSASDIREELDCEPQSRRFKRSPPTKCVIKTSTKGGHSGTPFKVKKTEKFKGSGRGDHDHATSSNKIADLNTQVWHARQTAGDESAGGSGTSHVKHWENRAESAGYGKKNAAGKFLCSVVGCPEVAQHGAHVYTGDQGFDDDPNLCYIVGTCTGHNKPPQRNPSNYPTPSEVQEFIDNNPGIKVTHPSQIRPGDTLEVGAVLVPQVITKTITTEQQKLSQSFQVI